MTVPPFQIRQGDTLPTLRYTLLDAQKKSVEIPAGAVVTFTMRDRTGTVVIEDLPTAVVSYDEGVVEYAWQAGDTDDLVPEGQKSMDYLGKFTLRLPEGSISFPNLDDIPVVVFA